MIQQQKNTHSNRDLYAFSVYKQLSNQPTFCHQCFIMSHEVRLVSPKPSTFLLSYLEQKYRIQEEKRAILERKRNLFLLIARYISDHGLTNTSEILAKECGLLAINDHVLCDNVDLETVYLDYMSYYSLKFGRPPKIAKRLEVLDLSIGNPARKQSRTSLAGRPQSLLRKCTTLKSDMELAREKVELLETSLGDTMIVSQLRGDAQAKDEELKCSQIAGVERLLKPLRDFANYTPEWNDLAKIVCRYLLLIGLYISFIVVILLCFKGTLCPLQVEQ